jgi:RNA polymerase sporulation-specific sigma factor
MKNLKNIQQEYYNKHGKSPKISYLASQLEVTTEHVMEILEAIDSLANVESLDNQLLPEGANYTEYVDEEQQNVNIIDLKTAIKELENRERQIIILRYFKDMTQQQVAKILGISQVQVSRIEKKVLQRMKEKIL